MWYQQPTGGDAFNLDLIPHLDVQAGGGGYFIEVTGGVISGQQISGTYASQADAQAALDAIIDAAGAVRA